MMPLALMALMSGSDSNHSDRKSTALMVSILTWAAMKSSPASLKTRPRRSIEISSRGWSDAGFGAGSSMIGLTSRDSSAIACEKIGAVSASRREKPAMFR